MNPRLEIVTIAAFVAAACALPGTFLVLRRVALMSDAISHSILPGIVIGFFLVGDRSHPLVIAGAALSGVLAVTLTEGLLKTRRVDKDAAIGLVFPVLFSIGVILITRYASGVHLDVDAVLLGELAFAPFNRATYFGLDLPVGIWVMGAILLLNVIAILLFYKELKLATFDPGLAAALGFAPTLIHYGLMTLVSVTAVGAFDHVGSILVVALMIAPPAAAYLLTNSLSRMLVISVVLGVLAAFGGYLVASWIDTSIAGAMATMSGVIFMITLLFAPEQGLIARKRLSRKRRERFAVEMLLVHLSRHENTATEAAENAMPHLTGELNWSPEFAGATVERAGQQGLIEKHGDQLRLTPKGRATAERVLMR
ncbi:MAG: metal ABC transporter permease [Chloroflexota bacterium]|nr:MAG: zinc ABC transporter permease [Chloroflexota bacterium]